MDRDARKIPERHGGPHRAGDIGALEQRHGIADRWPVFCETFTQWVIEDDFAAAPTWLWSWNLGIPESPKNKDAARTFATWATSKDYIKLVAAQNG